MYYDYFGLKQAPFKITPDTSLFFPGGDRGAILDALIYAIISGEGIVKLVGEVGSGKTTLCRMLEKELPANVEIVYLANPSLSPDNILHAIAFELDLKVQAEDSRLKVMQELQNYLLERHAENKQIVVFVEEAQSMPIATLEEIRLLSNLETAQNKLLQIVIFGQPELDTMISKPEIRQLKERITYSFYLSPFKFDDVKDYINSRLRSCGYRSVDLFNEKAIKTISKYSNGLLRRINILSDKALLACYADNANVVTVKHVRLAARETEFVDKQNTPVTRWALISLSSFMTVVALIVVLPKINFSSLVSNETMRIEQNSSTDIIENIQSSKTANASLMLIKEVRESVALTTQKESVAPSIEESEIVIVKTEQEVSLLRPDPAELKKAEWQLMTQNIFSDPEPTHKPALVEQNIIEQVAEVRTKEGLSDSDLLGIRDLIKAVSEHGEDDIAILNQLTILPSETAINHKSVANELTCKLCSTIIYRPLRDHKEL